MMLQHFTSGIMGVVAFIAKAPLPLKMYLKIYYEQ